MSLYALIAKAAREAWGTPCVVEHGATVLTYAQLDAAAARMQGALSAHGARPGDRILVQLSKCPEAAILWLACLRGGLVMVPLNTAYTPAEVASFAEDAEPAVPRSPDDLAALVYTSGTTGRSKGAMLSHDNLASNALVLKDCWRWQPDDVLVHVLPLYHVHGLFVALHGALLNGSTILFHREFDAGAAIADFACATVFMGVPTHYIRLLVDERLTAETCSKMRLFVSGSAPLLAATWEEFRARTGQPILERYGMTETGMIASNPYDGARLPGTVGYPVPGVSVRIADDTGREVARGEPGVLEVKGPNVFGGYWRMPERTAAEFRADGWFITGDVAEMAGDGRITLVGRARDLIISGGLNVYPREVELLIDALPGIGESAVIGVPHPDFGEGVVAVATRTDPALTEQDVIAAIRDRLARFKQPKRVLFVETLPRNAMGKVQKVILRTAHDGLFATP